MYTCTNSHTHTHTHTHRRRMCIFHCTYTQTSCDINSEKSFRYSIDRMIWLNSWLFENCYQADSVRLLLRMRPKANATQMHSEALGKVCPNGSWFEHYILAPRLRFARSTSCMTYSNLCISCSCKTKQKKNRWWFLVADPSCRVLLHLNALCGCLW